MISVMFNDEIIKIENNFSLLSVLIERGFSQSYYAVALNRSFIPRSLHSETLLKEGDVIQIVSPMQGG